MKTKETPRKRSLILLAALLLTPLVVPAQEQPVANRLSAWVPTTHPTWAPLPEVGGGKVTFRLKAPRAREVKVSGDFPGGKSLPLIKDEKGVWSVTVSAKPGLYTYRLILDGVEVLDPGNPRLQLSPTGHLNAFEIKGPQPTFFDVQKVPHGVVSTLTYDSKVTGDPRQVVVYTPPGYGTDASVQFPVFYLLHGYGDDEGAWSQFGFAHRIADNLLANGKMKPMIIVMPNGHATKRGDDASKAELLDEIIPLVEQNYRVKAGAKNRAIAGLSMGGARSLMIGLNNLDKFSWVAVFSASLPTNRFSAFMADPKAANEKLSLFWIGSGRQDSGFADVEKMVEAFNSAGIHPVWHPTEGAHCWPVWRDDLHEVLPLLFR